MFKEPLARVLLLNSKKLQLIVPDVYIHKVTCVIPKGNGLVVKYTY